MKKIILKISIISILLFSISTRGESNNDPSINHNLKTDNKLLNYPFIHYNLNEFVSKVILSPDGTNLYLIHSGIDGFSIVNIKDPSKAFFEGKYRPRSEYELSIIHDIVPSPNGNILYVGMTNGIHIFDISNPLNIQKIGRFRTSLTKKLILNQKGNILYAAGSDILKRGDILAESGLMILDVSTPNNIHRLGFYPYSNITDILLSKNQKTLYLTGNSTYSKSFTTLNVSNPTKPLLLSKLFQKTGEFASTVVLSKDETKAYVTHGKEDVIAGEYEIREYYLSILNIKDLSNPKILNTSKINQNFNMKLSLHEDKIYFGSYNLGLEIVSLKNNQIQKIGSTHTDAEVVDFTLSIDKKTAYLANGSKGLIILDLMEEDKVIDTDQDGISDTREIELGLNPNSKDSDGDGYLDNEEIGNIDTPTDTDGDGTIDALDLDSDNDGTPDAQEREQGTNPRDKNDYPSIRKDQQKILFLILMNRSNWLQRENIDNNSMPKIHMFSPIFMIEALKNKH